MSYSYERVERKRRSAAGIGASTSYRSTFGYWVPLALTVTAATIGLAAWMWSERKDDEEYSSEEEYKPGGPLPPGGYAMSGGMGPGPGPGPGPGGFPPGPGFDPNGPPQQGGFQGPPAGAMGPMQPGGFQDPGGFQGGPPPGGFQGPPPPGGFQGPPQQGGFQGGPQGAMPPGGFRSVDDTYTSRSTAVENQEDTTIVSRVSGALKRAPSPSQSYDWASKTVAAGVAAAGAMVGGALSSIRETSPEAFEDHERWSEEKDVQQGIKRRGTNKEFYDGMVELPPTVALPDRKRKSVAVVVSAVELDSDGEVDLGQHASVLSHLPGHVDLVTTKVFVLIYAPELKTHHLSAAATGRQAPSMTSSYSNISQNDLHTPAQTPGDFPSGNNGGILAHVEPNPIDEASTLYKTLHNQAHGLVEKDSMILPFTSRTGHRHILRSLAPRVVYIQESLCGRDGDLVADLTGWVKEVVVVIGDEGGHGGLVDTDDESGLPNGKAGEWWSREERTGLGRGVTVVESLKVGDDWRRRVNEQD